MLVNLSVSAIAQCTTICDRKGTVTTCIVRYKPKSLHGPAKCGHIVSMHAAMQHKHTAHVQQATLHVASSIIN
jgi:hypothetical protein